MRHISAHTEHQQFHILDVVNDALRAAALAPTIYDALDVTGDALRRLAEIARSEVRHDA